eukprot:TRINITY_DN41811_c0_g1_i1.p1 TRINITY_DN41811_c0_g1~~TRINITY_DN41811_c0_g1_i1.p1  ORF type:complete len:723 (+),score=74.09 TRINITY_DN41811_c0_g1_i1:313-2169(+)
MVYIGTAFIYHTAFITFQSPNGSYGYWDEVNTAVDILFGIDLVVSFFFSYTDHLHHEVVNLSMIVKRYLCSSFFLNLIACLPAQAIDLLVPSQLTKGARVTRLVKVAQLRRLSRFAKFANLESLERFRDLQLVIRHVMVSYVGLPLSVICSQRTMRLVGLVVALCWILHLLACGWAICGAFHEDFTQSWLVRREFSDGVTLLEKPTGVQWLHAVYFVLTVFTTVGFGDISPVSTIEILYAVVIMTVGIIIHSILISEVISILSITDAEQSFVQQHVAMIDRFCDHAELDTLSTTQMREWFLIHAATWSKSDFDTTEVTHFFNTRSIPHWLLNDLPDKMFGGQIKKNRLFYIHKLPARLLLNVALCATKEMFREHEMVYTTGEKSSCIYMVIEGTFALVQQLADNRATKRPKTKSIRRVASMSLEEIDVSCFSPHILFSRGSYFGSTELFLGKRRRTSTARTESECGSVLQLRWGEVASVIDECPEVMSALQSEARRLDKRIEASRKRFCGSFDSETLAARIIQAALRCFWQRTKSTPLEGTPLSDVAANFSPSTREGQRECPPLLGESSSPIDELRELRRSVARLEAGMEDLRFTIVKEVRSAFGIRDTDKLDDTVCL